MLSTIQIFILRQNEITTKLYVVVPTLLVFTSLNGICRTTYFHSKHPVLIQAVGRKDHKTDSEHSLSEKRTDLFKKNKINKIL